MNIQKLVIACALFAASSLGAMQKIDQGTQELLQVLEQAIQAHNIELVQDLVETNPSIMSHIKNSNLLDKADGDILAYLVTQCYEQAPQPKNIKSPSALTQASNDMTQRAPTQADRDAAEFQHAFMNEKAYWVHYFARTDQHSQPCPLCEAPVQDSEDTDHKQCQECQYEFCWSCLEPWFNHYKGHDCEDKEMIFYKTK